MGDVIHSTIANTACWGACTNLLGTLLMWLWTKHCLLTHSLCNVTPEEIGLLTYCIEMWRMWCAANYILLTAKKPCPGELNDFRLVALMSNVMRTMEWLLLHHLRPQVQHALDPLRFVFQEKVGVEDAIVHMVHWPCSCLVYLFTRATPTTCSSTPPRPGKFCGTSGDPRPHLEAVTINADSVNINITLIFANCYASYALGYVLISN